jgi:3-(3-hydroxy-phenyl)propionate hydroxylase
LAGTLCPNIALSSGQRLDDLAGQRFVLVVRDQLSDSSAARLAARDVVLVTAKEAPALGGWLGKSAAALVRPDRTVSVAGELEAVLEQLPHPRVHS